MANYTDPGMAFWQGRDDAQRNQFEAAQNQRRNALADIAQQRQDTQWEQGQQDRQAQQATAQQRALLEQGRAELDALKYAPPEARRAYWEGKIRARPELQQFGITDPEQGISALSDMLDRQLGNAPQSATAQTAEPASVREFQFAQQNPEFAKWQQGQRPPRAPGTLYKVQTPEGPRYMGPEQAQGLAPAEDGPPVQTPKSAMQLRKEFESQPEVKDFKVILPQLVSARKAPDTGAGDLQIVYTVAKLLDPQSVVRESETAMVLQSVNPISRIVGAGRFNFEGKGRLEPKVRAQLLSMLNERALATRQQYDAARKNFDEYAQQSGFDRQWVTGTHPAASIDPSARLGAAPARQEAPSSAVEFLRKNPQTKAAFKAKYGYLP